MSQNETSTIKKLKTNQNQAVTSPTNQNHGLELIKQEKQSPEVVKQEPGLKREKPKDDRSSKCPYLDTIDRRQLDFDFEKLCSVSLSQINVYACLVCGKYFQGRGTGTHAFTHSVAIDHRVFLNLETLKFYCLPENYEIKDNSLDDITFVLKPTFTKEDIENLDQCTKKVRAYDDTLYFPGIVGLNNIKANDYCNVVLHCISNVKPIRNFFLQESNYLDIVSHKKIVGDTITTLVTRFGELVRKIWNPRNFKAHVSPHEMLQAVVLCSKKRFQITIQDDPVHFLPWFLNSLDQGLRISHKSGLTSKSGSGVTKSGLGSKSVSKTKSGSKTGLKDATGLTAGLRTGLRTSSSIISDTFRGLMKVTSCKRFPIGISLDQKLQLMTREEFKEKVTFVPFLFLTLDLPPPPLFKDEMRENIIPQVQLTELLEKFNGQKEKEDLEVDSPNVSKYQIVDFPNFLIFAIKRFTKNTFFKEKNPTIVNFPIRDLDLSELMSEQGEPMREQRPIYDLIANIAHDGQAGKGNFYVQILHQATGSWFELQDLHVKEILPQMIPLSETYIQVWEKRK